MEGSCSSTSGTVLVGPAAPHRRSPVHYGFAGRWVKLRSGQADLDATSLASLVDRLTDNAWRMEPKVEQSTLDGGQEVVNQPTGVPHERQTSLTSSEYPLRRRFDGADWSPMMSRSRIHPCSHQPSAVPAHGQVLRRFCTMFSLLSVISLLPALLGIASTAYARGGDLTGTAKSECVCVGAVSDIWVGFDRRARPR